MVSKEFPRKECSSDYDSIEVKNAILISSRIHSLGGRLGCVDVCACLGELGSVMHVIGKRKAMATCVVAEQA